MKKESVFSETFYDAATFYAGRLSAPEALVLAWDRHAGGYMTMQGQYAARAIEAAVLDLCGRHRFWHGESRVTVGNVLHCLRIWAGEEDELIGQSRAEYPDLMPSPDECSDLKAYPGDEVVDGRRAWEKLRESLSLQRH